MQQEMSNKKPKTENLHKQPAKWQHLPTAPIRVPQQMHIALEAIALWADKQNNPEAALQKVLDFIKDK